MVVKWSCDFREQLIVQRLPLAGSHVVQIFYDHLFPHPTNSSQEATATHMKLFNLVIHVVDGLV